MHVILLGKLLQFNVQLKLVFASFRECKQKLAPHKLNLVFSMLAVKKNCRLISAFFQVQSYQFLINFIFLFFGEENVSFRIYITHLTVF